MNQTTAQFLEALLWANGLDGYTVHQVNPQQVEKLEAWINEAKEVIPPEAIDTQKRPLGHDLYFSLSGHGAGFWDWRNPEWEEAQAALEKFAGYKYLFEQWFPHWDEVTEEIFIEFFHLLKT